MKGLSKKTALICIVVLFYCLIVSLLPSCAQLFESDKHTGASSISLTLPNARRSLGDDSSLAAHHSPELLVQFYEATFLQNGVSRSVVRGTPGETINSGELPEGYYDIEVNAYDYDGIVIGYGKEKKVLVTDGAITTVTIKISAVHQGGSDSEDDDEGIMLYVSGGAASGGDGSETNPFATVQAALNAMSDSTRKYIVKISGNIEGAINITDSINAKKIVIEGTDQTSDILSNTSGGSERVITAASSRIPLELSNFKLTNNYAGGGGGGVKYGNGGIKISGSAKVTFKSVTITKCYPDTDSGGALYIASGAIVEMTDCTITENIATNGGGIYSEGYLTMTGCELSSNQAGSNGGNISSAGTLIMTNCRATNAEANAGGSLYINGNTTQLTACTITNSVAFNSGGGILVGEGKTCTITGTISGNITNGTDENAAIEGTTGSIIYNGTTYTFDTAHTL